jgi:FkbM family methyltransferase
MNQEILKQHIKLWLYDCGVHCRPARNVPSGTSRCLYRDVIPRTEQPVIFDVGANVGQTTIAFHHSFPNAEIHAFEPVSAIFEVLKKNTRRMAGVHPYHLALGEKNETRLIALDSADSYFTMNRARKADATTPKTLSQQIEIITLDAFVERQHISRIHVLKTDTEGYELEVLSGARNTLAAGRVQAILVETTLTDSNNFHVPLDSIRQLLGNYSFRLCGVYDIVYHASGDLYFCNALFKRDHSLQPPL